MNAGTPLKNQDFYRFLRSLDKKFKNFVVLENRKG